MVQSTELQRFESLVDADAAQKNAPPSAAKDAEHSTTGWSAYDVWRARVFNAVDDSPPRGNS